MAIAVLYGIFFLVLATTAVSCFALSWLFFKDSTTSYDSSGGDIFGGLAFGMLGIVVSALAILAFIDMFKEINPMRYSSKDYRIETEITTRGEQSDTTYIIIKK